MSSSTQRNVPHYRGDVPGCFIGQVWEKRMDMFSNGMHKQVQAGIDGRPDCGCYSIVLSAGYEDDIDEGDEIVYTGCGGMDDRKVQVKDQEFSGKNASLVVSCNKKYPVRVIRGYNCPSPYAPVSGYRYDGLYTVTEYWSENKRGFNICRYRMKRLPDQPPLTKRADYNPAKKVKRPIASAGAKSARTPASLRGDMDYMYEPVDAMTQRAAQDNFCVVCERVIASGCDAEHIESHVKELWDSLELSEKEKIAMRGVINATRIENVIDALLSDEPAGIPSSSSFVWP